MWIFNSWLTSAVINAVLPLRLRPVTARRKCRSIPRGWTSASQFSFQSLPSPVRYALKVCLVIISYLPGISRTTLILCAFPRRHYFIPRVTRLASRLSSGSGATASSISAADARPI